MSAVTARLSAALADRYRIERELGAGGMATVHLAHDLRHDREVAIKVLHPDLGAALGSERFLSEIKTTARLQHPHILPLLDSGTADGLLFYVMPFVAGETLRGRLERERQLPLDDALRIAREVADALASAHALGIIHRDIKPENILLQGGHALVADFGIALAVQSAGGPRMTQTGLSLGTPQYMSPEQAMGERQIDARTDQYALAAVTYEMLCGEPPFTGPSVQAIVARVLSEEPRPITTQRRAVPPEVEGAVLRGLEKLPADRFASVAEFAATLSRRDGTGVRTAAMASASPAVKRNVLLLGGALAVATIAAMWGWLRPIPAPVVMRYRVSIDSVPNTRDWTGDFALSPDGRVLVHIGGAARPLGVRRRDELEFTPLAGTEFAQGPCFSPDGAHVAFYANGSLVAVPIEGGPPAVIARGVAAPDKCAWGVDGNIYASFARADGRPSIGRRRPEASAAWEEFTVLDTAGGEYYHTLPEPLPGGRGVLFHLRYVDGRQMIAVAESPGGRVRTLMDGVRAVFAQGRMVYSTVDGRLWSVPFDERSLQITGTPSLVAEGIPQTIVGPIGFSLSASGTLAYASDDPLERRELAWRGRDGSVTPLDREWTGSFYAPVISPDGRRIAVGMGSAAKSDIWVRDISQGPAVRLTVGTATHHSPAWSADGRSVSFLATDEANSNTGAVWRQPADGSAPAARMLAETRAFSDHLWSPAGGWLLARTTSSTAGNGDIVAIRPGVDSAARPILAEPHSEWSPTLSPDGRWLAYATNESGRMEVYVTAFPGSSSAKWQVSTAGGITPRWSPRGDEIFFLDLEWNMTAARVTTTPTFATRGIQRLFPAAGMVTLATSRRNFDVTADGQRFLVVQPAGGEMRRELTMVENWIETQRGRAPE
jgi:hypothetical protein